MVESSSLLMSRNNVYPTAIESSTNVLSTASANSSSGLSGYLANSVIGTSRCGILETRVRGAWYRVLVTLESEYLSVSLDETCDPIDHTTTLNETLR